MPLSCLLISIGYFKEGLLVK
ncbi:hypothetical protein LCGC14_1803220, partial [marine sediment metagenome]